ncbi:MAG: PilZ domain-containing protein [Pseudomonadota bacterium]
MENEHFCERRKHPRIPLDLAVDVNLIPSDNAQSVGDSIRCKCRDISGGGISFYSMDPYSLHSVLRLDIAIDELNIKVMGKVLWVKKFHTAPFCLTGVQFLNIYEQDFKELCSYIDAKCL